MMSSSEGSKTVTIKIETRVKSWLEAIRDANNYSSISEVIESLVRKNHPDIDAIVQVANQKEAERLAALRELMEEE